MKKRYKIIGITLAVFVVCITLVGATLLGFFEPKIVANINAKSPISIDGSSSGTIYHNFTAYGGCCYCYTHIVCNVGCEGLWLNWTHIGSPNLVGIDVIVYPEPICYQGVPEPNGGVCPCTCDYTSMDLPFYLDAGDCITLCFCYEFDVLIKPDNYTIISKLTPGVI